MRIFLIGYMGSGKTTIGKVVSNRLGLSFIDMDSHIENRQFKTIAQLFNEEGEEHFRKIERECLKEVSQYENVIISTGGGVPCFFDNMELMNRNGVTIYIRWSPEELSQRLKATNIHKRPVLASYKGNDLVSFIASGLSKREAFYNQSQHIVSGTDDSITEQIIQLINSIR